MNLGMVRFNRGGRSLVATLDGAGDWQCEDQSIVDLLERECSLDDYSDADGAYGMDHVIRAAELLGGQADFSETANNGVAQPNSPNLFV